MDTERAPGESEGRQNGTWGAKLTTVRWAAGDVEEALGLSGWDESGDAASHWALPTAGTTAETSMDVRAPRTAVVQHPRCGAPPIRFGVGSIVEVR